MSISMNALGAAPGTDLHCGFGLLQRNLRVGNGRLGISDGPNEPHYDGISVRHRSISNARHDAISRCVTGEAVHKNLRDDVRLDQFPVFHDCCSPPPHESVKEHHKSGSEHLSSGIASSPCDAGYQLVVVSNREPQKCNAGLAEYSSPRIRLPLNNKNRVSA